MRIAVDALPINNFSGRRVLLGHLRNAAAASVGRHSFHVFHHAGNRDLERDLGPNVEWIECPVGASWPRRLVWQALAMRRRLREIGADLLLSTSGAVVPFAGVPQIVLAQNPWCFVPQFHRSLADRVKALLQRAGYRRAQRTAEAVFYLSDYVGAAYRANAGAAARHGATLYVGIDDAMFDKAVRRPSFVDRALEIVTVSVMTPHKAIEDLVATLAVLHRRGVAARLALVGPWSDAGYRAAIERRVREHGLDAFVTVTGGVDEASLVEHYRRARAFALLSRCESFGIPSVEAQVFGTPTVVANACAQPEVAGPGGVVAPVGDAERTADALAALLTDERAWERASVAAIANAERFRWNRVSTPLVDYLLTLPGTA
jgi:glycosyltransferase involved in cell wall biosynthesis